MTTTKQRFYSTGEVAEQTGITFRQIDYWCTRGAIPGHEHPGSGNNRTFTAEELAILVNVAMVVRTFTRMGLQPSTEFVAAAYAKIANAFSRGEPWVDLGDTTVEMRFRAVPV